MTNQEKFIQVFGIVAWQAMVVPSGLAEQFKEYWTSPCNEMDCRDCKEFKDCPCGKDGHENGTSQGYSMGECKDFQLQERSGDCISRRAAIDALMKWYGCEPEDVGAFRTIGLIEKLPPVNLQPKTGHWIDKDEKSAVCLKEGGGGE